MIGVGAALFVAIVLIGAAIAALEIRELKTRYKSLLESIKNTEMVRDEWAGESTRNRDMARALQVELDAWRKKHENQRVELKRLGEHRVELLTIIQVAEQARGGLAKELGDAKSEIYRLKRLAEMTTASATQDQADALRCNLARVTGELEAVKAKRPKRDPLGKFVKK